MVKAGRMGCCALGHRQVTQVMTEKLTRFDPQRYVDVIESRPQLDKAKLGLPGRDGEIETASELIRNMGALGIPVWCYEWMPIFTGMRTSTSTPTCGGALVTGYDHTLMQDAPLTEYGEVSEETLWETLAYCLEKVVPVAEEANVKLAMHPDDLPGVIRHFGAQEKIFFVHVRDVRGTADCFVETFHDDGKTDMLACMQAYRDVGFAGVRRPDHVPTMAGDSNANAGYSATGRLFAIGYLKGCTRRSMQAALE